MERTRLIAAMLALAVLATACHPTSQPSSPTPEPLPSLVRTATAAPLASAVAASPDTSPTIPPDAITRPALTCGDPERRFPLEALDGPGLAELGPDPAAQVLRRVLAEEGSESGFPQSGWHRVVEHQDGVSFVAAGDQATPWWIVTVGVLAGVLQATEYGQCHLAIAAPPGLSYAQWWLDPDRPLPDPETTRLGILLLERECASGKPPIGRVEPPVIVTSEAAIVIAIPIRKQLTGQDCQGNPPFPLEVRLPEAVGSRALYDASAFPPRLVTTEPPP